MKTTVLLVGLGGALGSIMRYLMTYRIICRITRLPELYGTLAVNVTGCLLIGIAYGLAERHDWFSPQMRWLITTGLCGGYTTFSAFTYENVRLLQNGHYGFCFVYILAGIALCLAATFAGIMIAG
ncbi:MAG: fluoride efflux transporter CrcB [Bacteroidales bacterium]|jgi:CrcB protein|nr:fluoride efflux transporter CrcB [Bacteroidales bacterium]